MKIFHLKITDDTPKKEVKFDKISKLIHFLNDRGFICVIQPVDLTDSTILFASTDEQYTYISEQISLCFINLNYELDIAKIDGSDDIYVRFF
jgi:hypothetical protein